jgi:hypothetical protein
LQEARQCLFDFRLEALSSYIKREARRDSEVSTENITSQLASRQVVVLAYGRFRHYQGRHYQGHQQNRLTKIVFHFMASMSSPGVLNSPTKAVSLYKAARDRLRDSLPKSTRKDLSQIKLPDFKHIASVEQNLAELEEAIKTFIQVRKECKEHPTRMQAVSDIVRDCFRATYPFTSVLLTIGNTGTQVSSHAVSNFDRFRYQFSIPTDFFAVACLC